MEKFKDKILINALFRVRKIIFNLEELTSIIFLIDVNSIKFGIPV